MDRSGDPPWYTQAYYQLCETLSTHASPLIHLRFKEYRCIWKSGKISSSTLRTLTELMLDANIPNASIKLGRDKCFHFSSSIPESLRQKIRNILLFD